MQWLSDYNSYYYINLSMCYLIDYNNIILNRIPLIQSLLWILDHLSFIVMKIIIIIDTIIISIWYYSIFVIYNWLLIINFIINTIVICFKYDNYTNYHY